MSRRPRVMGTSPHLHGTTPSLLSKDMNTSGTRRGDRKVTP